jgi:hypothetical protein
MKKAFSMVGPGYIAIAVASVVSADYGAVTWVANRILDRQQERVTNAIDYTTSQKRRIDVLEDQVNRMPLDYVLKVDFLREIQEMHENLDRLTINLISLWKSFCPNELHS